MVGLALVAAGCAGAGDEPPPLSAQPPAAVRAELLAVADRLEAEAALFVGGSQEVVLRQAVEAAPPGSVAAWEAREKLGRELLRLGDSAGALAELEAA
jgi:hypothetical protein